MANDSAHDTNAEGNGDRPGDRGAVRALGILHSPAALDSLLPATPPLARRYYPDLRRLARTYRVAAWVSLAVGPLIGAMSLTAALEGFGRFLWIVLILAGTAFTFLTWRSTSEFILALVQIADGVSRTEQRTGQLEKQLAERSSGKRASRKRTATKRRGTKSGRTPGRAKTDEGEEEPRRTA